MGAPIWYSLTKQEKKEDGFVPCQIDYRDNESYWVFGSKSETIVVFNIHLPSAEDVALARIFLQEMVDTKRAVTSCQAITYHDKIDPTNVV